jgi:fluoride exporter
MSRLFTSFLLVGLGGMLGSFLRYGMTLVTRDASISVPWGTLLSNLAGCFLIGAVAGLAEARAVLSGEARLFLATGLCGGFTTLSSLVYELQKMLADREIALASLYFGATFAGSFTAFFIGFTAVRLIAKG